MPNAEKVAEYKKKIEDFLHKYKNTVIPASKILKHLLQEYGKKWFMRHKELAKNLIKDLDSNHAEAATLDAVFGGILHATTQVSPKLSSTISEDDDFNGLLHAFVGYLLSSEQSSALHSKLYLRYVTHKPLFDALKLPGSDAYVSPDEDFNEYLAREKKAVARFVDEKSPLARALNSDAKQITDAKQTAYQAEKNLGWKEIPDIDFHNEPYLSIYSTLSELVASSKPMIPLQDTLDSLQAHCKLEIEGIIKICSKSKYGFPVSAEECGKLLKDPKDPKDQSPLESFIDSKQEPWYRMASQTAIAVVLHFLNRIGDFSSSNTVAIKPLILKDMGFYFYNLPPMFGCYALGRLIEKNLLQNIELKKFVIELAWNIFNNRDKKHHPQAIALATSYHILKTLDPDGKILKTINPKAKLDHKDLEMSLRELHQKRVRKAADVQNTQPVFVRFVELELLMDMDRQKTLVSFPAKVSVGSAADTKHAGAVASATTASAGISSVSTATAAKIMTVPTNDHAAGYKKAINDYFSHHSNQDPGELGILKHLLQTYVDKITLDSTNKTLAKQLIAAALPTKYWEVDSKDPKYIFNYLNTIFSIIWNDTTHNGKSSCSIDLKGHFAGLLYVFADYLENCSKRSDLYRSLYEKNKSLFVALALPQPGGPPIRDFEEYLAYQKAKIAPYVDEKCRHLYTKQTTDGKQTTDQVEKHADWRKVVVPEEFKKSLEGFGSSRHYYQLTSSHSGRPILVIQNTFDSLQAYCKLELEAIVYRCTDCTLLLPTSAQQYHALRKKLPLVKLITQRSVDPDIDVFGWDVDILHCLSSIGDFGSTQEATKKTPLMNIMASIDNMPPIFSCYLLGRLIEKNLLQNDDLKRNAVERAWKLFTNREDENYPHAIVLAMSYHILKRLDPDGKILKTINSNAKLDHKDLELNLRKLHDQRFRNAKSQDMQGASYDHPYDRFVELELLSDMNRQGLLDSFPKPSNLSVGNVGPIASAPPGAASDTKHAEAVVSATTASASTATAAAPAFPAASVPFAAYPKLYGNSIALIPMPAGAPELDVPPASEVLSAVDPQAKPELLPPEGNPEFNVELVVPNNILPPSYQSAIASDSGSGSMGVKITHNKPIEVAAPTAGVAAVGIAKTEPNPKTMKKFNA